MTLSRSCHLTKQLPMPRDGPRWNWGHWNKGLWTGFLGGRGSFSEPFPLCYVPPPPFPFKFNHYPLWNFSHLLPVSRKTGLEFWLLSSQHTIYSFIIQIFECPSCLPGTVLGAAMPVWVEVRTVSWASSLPCLLKRQAERDVLKECEMRSSCGSESACKLKEMALTLLCTMPWDCSNREMMGLKEKYMSAFSSFAKVESSTPWKLVWGKEEREPTKEEIAVTGTEADHNDYSGNKSSMGLNSIWRSRMCGKEQGKGFTGIITDDDDKPILSLTLNMYYFL